MKTLVSRKSVVILLVLLCTTLVSYAVSPKNYMYDTQEENGLIVEKTVFLSNNGLLNKHIKFEFTYHNDGKVSEKKAYRWNKNKQEWEPSYLISYSYNGNNEEIESLYGMWDNKKKDYSLNQQVMNLPMDSYEDIFS